MGGDPQPGPCRPRPSRELSDPREQTNPPSSFFSTTRHGRTGVALRMYLSVSALICLSVKKLTQRRDETGMMSHSKETVNRKRNLTLTHGSRL